MTAPSPSAAPLPPLPELARFDLFVEPEPNTGCWLWSGSLGAHNYGAAWVNGKTERAHRRSWRLHRGPIPDGLWVLHRCDNPPCVNPDHLFLGTHQDNVNDMVAKHRMRAQLYPATVRGANNGNAKMTLETVVYLRRLARAGTEKSKDAARRLGLSLTAVQRAASGKTWPECAEPPCAFPPYNPILARHAARTP